MQGVAKPRGQDRLIPGHQIPPLQLHDGLANGLYPFGHIDFTGLPQEGILRHDQSIRLARHQAEQGFINVAERNQLKAGRFGEP